MKKKVNFGVQWHITDICNLQCRHCYRKDKVEDLSLEENIRIFENFIRLVKKKDDRVDISLTGGEALLYPQFEELVSYLRGNEYVDDIHLMTNGTFLEKKHIDLLKRYGIKAVQVSLDGIQKIHDSIRGEGTFEKSINGLRLLHDNGIMTQVHLVFNRSNYDSIFELISYLDDLGIVDGFLATHLVPVGRGNDMKDMIISKEQWKNYQLEIEKKDSNNEYKNLTVYKGRPTWNLVCDEYGSSCPAGINGFDLLSNGDVMMCRRLDIVIGNLLKDSIFKIWYDNDDIWMLRDKDKLKGKCGSCTSRHKCGGCRALAYSLNGDYLAEDPYCWKE